MSDSVLRLMTELICEASKRIALTVSLAYIGGRLIGLIDSYVKTR